MEAIDHVLGRLTERIDSLRGRSQLDISTSSQPFRHELDALTSSVNSNLDSLDGTLSESQSTVTSNPNKLEMGESCLWDQVRNTAGDDERTALN